MSSEIPDVRCKRGVPVSARCDDSLGGSHDASCDGVEDAGCRCGHCDPLLAECGADDIARCDCGNDRADVVIEFVHSPFGNLHVKETCRKCGHAWEGTLAKTL